MNRDGTGKGRESRLGVALGGAASSGFSATRRGLLGAVPLGAIGVVAAAPAAAAVGEDGVPQRRGSGYALTPHVSAYYRSCRF